MLVFFLSLKNRLFFIELTIGVTIHVFNYHFYFHFAFILLQPWCLKCFAANMCIVIFRLYRISVRAGRVVLLLQLFLFQIFSKINKNEDVERQLSHVGLSLRSLGSELQASDACCLRQVQALVRADWIRALVSDCRHGGVGLYGC